MIYLHLPIKLWPSKLHIGQAAPLAASPQQQQPSSAQRRPRAAAARLGGKGQHRAVEGAWKVGKNVGKPGGIYEKIRTSWKNQARTGF